MNPAPSSSATSPTPTRESLAAISCSVSLPVPFYRDEYVTIYHGDCREIVPLLPSFDLLMTDPKAAFHRGWFFVFPMNHPCMDPRGAGRVWWRCLDDTVQRAFRTANKAAGTEGITPHHMRHAWATHAHREGACMRDLQEILGHRDPKTTAKYIAPDVESVPSPIETLGIAI